MKTMTCKQLDGVCDKEFHAETLEELGEMCKNHAMEMVDAGDEEHKKRMEMMKEGMNDPEAVKTWYMQKQKEFDAVAED